MKKIGTLIQVLAVVIFIWAVVWGVMLYTGGPVETFAVYVPPIVAIAAFMMFGGGFLIKNTSSLQPAERIQSLKMSLISKIMLGAIAFIIFLAAAIILVERFM